jgi:hypothetical protein
VASTGPAIPSITDKLSRAIAQCLSEEDLRVSTEIILREALPDLPTPQYEKSVKTLTFRGRADAVHEGLVIEYEKPRSMRQASKREEAAQQVCDYLTGFTLGSEAKHQKSSEPTLFPADVIYSQAEEERLAAHVGLASDGEQFVFIQRRGKQWHTETRRLDEDTVEKLLLWLRAMSRKDLSPENLIADFGPQSSIATAVVGVLATLVNSKEYPKANVIYDEWRRIFGIVYGTEQLHRTQRDPEAKALTAAYRLDIGVDFPVLLFAIHTYYALLMKMLATEVIVARGGLGNTFIGALSRSELRHQLIQLESGEVVTQRNWRP